jgi:PKD repeat protein
LTAPTANFSAPAAAGINTSVQFTDASTGAPTSWFWTFGDGASSIAQNPTHLYRTAGVYFVSLTASNSIGSNVVTRTVTVTACVSALEPCRAVVGTGAAGGHRARSVPARPPR